MKKKLLFLTIIALFSFIGLRAQNEFITIWKPSNPSATIPGKTPSTSTQVWFPGVGSSYTITWEEVGYASHTGTLADVSSTEGNPVLIDFGTPLNPVAADAAYKVKVSNGSGSFTQIRFLDQGYNNNNNHRNFLGDTEKIMEITQWGNFNWSSMEQAFGRCVHMNVTATDVLDLSHATSMKQMFHFCHEMTGNDAMSNWNTSTITDMSGLFSGCYVFNADISGWNTALVTDMSDMFLNANVFNKPLANWNTANVTNMQGMFFAAEKFNQPVTNWNTQNVTDMSFMFGFCLDFNQPLNHFKTGKVTTMEQMLKGCEKFNQPLDAWNTSKVTTMAEMFWMAYAFNQNLNNWDVSSVTNMYSMFSDLPEYNQPMDRWNTAKVSDMDYMFYQSAKFNQNLGSWNLSSLTKADFMLSHSGLDCVNYDKTLIGWANNTVTPDSITLDVSELVYSSAPAMAARTKLTTPVADGGKGWNITGDTYDAACSPSTSIDKPALTKEIKEISVAPNPAASFFAVSGIEKPCGMSITDLSGKKIMEKTVLPNEKISVSALPKGIYLVKVNNKTAKLVVK